MNIKLEEITSWEDEHKSRFMKSLSGCKSIHLIGTYTPERVSHLDLLHHLITVDAKSCLIGMMIQTDDKHLDTYQNMISKGVYTINHIHKSMIRRAHYASLQFANSTFDHCNLTEEITDGFAAPFVKESQVKFGMSLQDDIELQSINHRLIIGQVQSVFIDDKCMGTEEGSEVSLADSICTDGSNQYYTADRFKKLPEATLNELPNFTSKERPDQVVFDEETQRYHSSVLPYGTNIGAPSIHTHGLSSWKSSSINAFNHNFNNKVEHIKSQYQELMDEYHVNEMVYRARMNFEPIVGKPYHLYLDEKKNEQFLSLIPPNSWKKEHLGTFRLNHDRLWEKLPSNDSY